MSDGSLSLVFACGERAVAHAVDPGAPAREVRDMLKLYLAPDGCADGCALIWLGDEGEVRLDPSVPIGEQVPPEAEIEIRPE